MEFEEMNKNNTVIKFGDNGTKFYIILRGSVSVRAPSIVEKDFTFIELLEFLFQNKEWIMDNDKYHEVLGLIQDILPELVSETLRKELKLNFELVKAVLKGKIISDIQASYHNGVPGFENLHNNYGKIVWES